MSNFQHHDRLHGQQIRLLRLLPGAWLDELEAQLYVADRSHHYAALSYAWGSTRRANRIIINGKLYPITFNLDRALRAIRREQEPLVLWVDSICINQSDATEKGHQVGLMHDIFRWATEVIAYLGDGLDRSRKDYRQRFEKLGYCPPVHFTGLQEEDDKLVRNFWETTSNYLSEHNEILCTYALILALHSGQHISGRDLTDLSTFLVDAQRLDQIVERIRLLATSVWWNRVWIIQEACAARKLSLLYGRVSIPFHFISSAVSAVHRLSGLVQGSLSDSSLCWAPPEELQRILLYLGDKADSINTLRLQETYSDVSHITTNSALLWLLRNFRHRKSSEPRDKIFALLRLAEDMAVDEKVFKHGRVAIETDYNSAVGELFSGVAYEIICQTGLLWITTCDLLAKSRNDIPSWVPDWSSENPVPGFSSSRLRIQAEIYCKFNASRAVFRRLDPPEEHTATLWRPEDHYRYLATEDATKMGWGTVHRLPQLSGDGLRARGYICGDVKYISEPILGDLSNICDAIFQIIPRESPLLDQWRARNHGSFLDVVMRVLFSSMRIKHDHPHELLPDELRQAEHWMLIRILNKLRSPDLYRYSFDPVSKKVFPKTKFLLNGGGEAGLSIVWVPHKWNWMGEWRSSKTIGFQVPLFTFSTGPDPKHALDACETERVWSEDYSWIEDTLRATATGFRLFMTRQGMVGLGPESMLHNDWVEIIEGGLMPYVLRELRMSGPSRRRRSPYEATRYLRMMGSCYVEGIMRGGLGERDALGDDADGPWDSLEDELRSRLGPGIISKHELYLV